MICKPKCVVSRTIWICKPRTYTTVRIEHIPLITSSCISVSWLQYSPIALMSSEFFYINHRHFMSIYTTHACTVVWHMHPHARAMLVCTVMNQFVYDPLVERAFACTPFKRAFERSTHPKQGHVMHRWQTRWYVWMCLRRVMPVWSMERAKARSILFFWKWYTHTRNCAFHGDAQETH